MSEIQQTSQSTLAGATSMSNSSIIGQSQPDNSRHERSSSYIGRLSFEKNGPTADFDHVKPISEVMQRDLPSLGCNISKPCFLFSTPSVTGVPDSTYSSFPSISLPLSSICKPITPVETDVDEPFSYEYFNSWESQAARLDQEAQRSRTRSPSLSPLISRRNFSAEDLSWLGTLDTSGFSYGDDSDQSSPISLPLLTVDAADGSYDLSDALHVLPQPDGINTWTLSLSPLSVSPTISTSYTSMPSSVAHDSLRLGEELERSKIASPPIVMESASVPIPLLVPSRSRTDEREPNTAEYAWTLLASALATSNMVDSASEAESELQIRNPRTTKLDDTSNQELQLPSRATQNQQINSINGRMDFISSSRRIRSMVLKLKTIGCKVRQFVATKSRTFKSASRRSSQSVYLTAGSNKVVQPPALGLSVRRIQVHDVIN